MENKINKKQALEIIENTNYKTIIKTEKGFELITNEGRHIIWPLAMRSLIDQGLVEQHPEEENIYIICSLAKDENPPPADMYDEQNQFERWDIFVPAAELDTEEQSASEFPEMAQSPTDEPVDESPKEDMYDEQNQFERWDIPVSADQERLWSAPAGEDSSHKHSPDMYDVQNQYNRWDVPVPSASSPTKPSELERVLMTRDGMTLKEARARVQRASEDLQATLAEEGPGAIDCCEYMLEEFGLEADYLFDLF